MKKFSLIILSCLLVLGISISARAEQSPSTATGTSYRDNQVFTIGYNVSTSDITSNAVVILDTSSDATVGTTLGAYINTTTTADNLRVFGVTDETIEAGTSGRVCIRGAHKVWDTANSHTAGDIVGTSTTRQKATTYTTSDGTAGGQLGWVLSATAASDGIDMYWVYLDPKIHK